MTFIKLPGNADPATSVKLVLVSILGLVLILVSLQALLPQITTPLANITATLASAFGIPNFGTILGLGMAFGLIIYLVTIFMPKTKAGSY